MNCECGVTVYGTFAPNPSNSQGLSYTLLCVWLLVQEGKAFHVIQLRLLFLHTLESELISSIAVISSFHVE